MHSNRLIALRGRYVFPIVSEPIENGIVMLRGDRIVAVGNAAEVAPIDLGNVAILPGLVNAHTHLEFSHLDQPLGEPGEPLPTWIRRVVAARITDPDAKRLAIARGGEQSRAAAVTAIGEISTSAWDYSVSAMMTIFREIICLDRSRFDAVLWQLDHPGETQTGREVDSRSSRSIASTCTADPTAAPLPGLSPHAPYSVHPELLGPLCEIARRNRWPMAMHLAESPEEMELLGTGGGPFRELLGELGAWRDDASPRGLRPLDYLRALAGAPRALVVHGNYLDAEERTFVAERQKQMAVVYCPRTHAYFGHKPYPLDRLWTSGVTVCIGTDSRASNPDLNLFEELKFAAGHHPTVPPCEILRMGTLNGARMLSGSETSGALEAGRKADLAIVSLPNHNAADPYELLFSTEAVIGGWKIEDGA
jgi:cytosine/adenosine deaminase-related metal-dependent hydrolase